MASKVRQGRYKHSMRIKLINGHSCLQILIRSDPQIHFDLYYLNSLILSNYFISPLYLHHQKLLERIMQFQLVKLQATACANVYGVSGNSNPGAGVEFGDFKDMT